MGKYRILHLKWNGIEEYGLDVINGLGFLGTAVAITVLVYTLYHAVKICGSCHETTWKRRSVCRGVYDVPRVDDHTLYLFACRILIGSCLVHVALD